MSLFGGARASPAPIPATPSPVATQQDGVAESTSKLLAAQTGGFSSYMKTGGLGVPDPRTSSARLLGL
jgi:hypothetical protein